MWCQPNTMRCETTMYLSIFSDVIAGTTPAEVARRTRDHGIRSVQLVPDEIRQKWGSFRTNTVRTLEAWAEAYAAEGIEVCAIAGYLNLMHHDPATRRHNIDLFCALVRQMPAAGCRLISTETGTLAASGDWTADPRNAAPYTWDDLRRVSDEIVNVAAQHDVCVLYEPYIANICDSAERGARIVREVASPHLALVMDPTNWFDTATATPAGVPTVIQQGFEAERGLFRLAHAKDVVPTAPGSALPALPAPGQGILDYPLYLRLLREHDYDGALVIEHLTEQEIEAAVAFLRQQLAHAGITEAR